MRPIWQLFIALLVSALAQTSLAGRAMELRASELQGESGIPLDTVALRVTLGVTDKEATRWDGQVRLSAGEIIRIEPWRMRPDDQIMGRTGWKATSYQLTSPPQGSPRFSPTGVVLTAKPARGAQFEISTTQGDFRILMDEVRPGVRQFFLDGRVMVDGVVPAMQITSGDTENDFPAAATAPDGTVWVTYVAHTYRGPAALEPFGKAPDDFKSLIPQGGGDQVMLLHCDGTAWSKPIAVSQLGLDVSRPAITVDGNGSVRVVWSQNDAGNWDLFESVFDTRNASGKSQLAKAPRRVTTGAGADVVPALTTDDRGRCWVAWQGWHEGVGDIWLMNLDGTSRKYARPTRVTVGPGNKWSPALIVRPDGIALVSYDSYQSGNYDVYDRTYDLDDDNIDPPLPAAPIAQSSRFEARPSIMFGPDNRAWVAYEQRASDWGKDFGPLARVQGSPLYMRGSSIQVRSLDRDGRKQPAAELMANFPEDLRRFNSFPRLAFDGRGRMWVLFRHRHEAVWGANPSAMMVGGVWLEYATCYDGEEWSPPILLTSSDNLLDVRPALARLGSGESARLIAIYPSDGRLRHEVIGDEQQRKIFFTGGGCTVPGQAKNDLFVAVLPDLGPVKPDWKLVPVDATQPGPAGVPPDVPAARGATALDPDPEPAALHPHNADDLSRIRNYRIEAGNKKYQLLRGEFHRHTELSMDGGEDGSLEDMWRYAIDAAALDWIGNGDHDSGGGREYPWWIIQKTTDIFHHAPHFVPMFTYERSVPYPNGHRNVMFDRRGIRTLPRLMGDDPGGVSPDDTKMLYRYLKEMRGICASHTSGTGMGTDWRDNDPLAEPVVEIYQGDRNSYEHLGGPRVAAKQGEAIGGWKPLGMIWNAMAMGHKFGFQSSSDHWSTHISYAIAIAEEPTRSAILDAFKKRHCYGATDNIIMDVRMGDAVMGDEVTFKRGAKPEPKISVSIHGTAPLARVDVIKDFQFVYATDPKTESIQFSWTDPAAKPGLSWYYVRVVQADGQVAWGSPIWVQIPR